MMTYDEEVARDARLCILKELSLQVDGRANEVSLTRVLDVFGIRRSREWVRSQLLKLSELGAVHTTEAGTVMVAALTRYGRDHVDRRTIIDGVARPSDEP